MSFEGREAVWSVGLPGFFGIKNDYTLRFLLVLSFREMLEIERARNLTSVDKWSEIEVKAAAALLAVSAINNLLFVFGHILKLRFCFSHRLTSLLTVLRCRSSRIMTERLAISVRENTFGHAKEVRLRLILDWLIDGLIDWLIDEI